MQANAPYPPQDEPAYRPEDYEEYPDFPQSMLEPMFHTIRQFKIMALEIKGMTRSFTFKKGNEMLVLRRPYAGRNAGSGHELLLEHVPGTDNGDGTRTGHQERHGSVRVQDHHRNERIMDI